MKKEIYKEKLELKEVSIDNDVPFTKINCPSCDEQVTADNVELGKAVAKCGSCHVLFPIEDTIALLSTSRDKSERPMVKPEGVDVFEFKNQLEVVVKSPSNWVDIVMFIWIMIFPLISVIIMAKSLVAGNVDIIPIATTVFANVVPLYWYFKRKKNNLIFNISKDTLDVERRPMYMIKDKSFNRESIEQVYIKPGYGLYIIINDFGEQKHIPIYISYNPVVLRYLERTIENYLGIEDMDYA